MIRLEMKTYIKIVTEKKKRYKLHLKSKIDKYEYVTGEEILPSDHLIKVEQDSKVSLLQKSWTNKQKQLKIKKKSK